MRSAVGIAAAVAVAASFWVYRAGRGIDAAGTDAVAVLTQASDARWRTGPARLETGQFVGTGEMELESGWAVLEFVSGCEVVIAGPARIRIIAADEIECRHGSLTVHQPTRTARFVVHTPAGVIEDIHQAVAMQVRPDATDLLVDGGRASLRLGSGGGSPIPEGEALRLAESGSLEKVPGIQEELARQLGRGEELMASAKTTSSHWLVASKRQNKDPDLLLRYTFDDLSPNSMRVPNQAGSQVMGLDGVIGGAVVREGRWPYKKALEFKDRFDGIRVSVPGSYAAVTMAAWVRVDGLDHKANAIFLSEGIIPGGFHWHIMESGALQMKVLATPYAPYESPPVITPDTFGKWLHVAVVYDLHGNKVSHHLNGKLVSRRSGGLVQPVRIGDAMIGNWDPVDYRDPDKDWNIRNFHGRMDDFAIYQKALTENEIKQLYEQGRN